uniref:CSON001756 protein n=1 Tax=Culicoides sonorensis TaxID=179676 RepID=A0A336LU83_CULSO
MDLNQPIHNIEYLCRICLQEFPDIDDHFISFDTILEEPENISYLQAFQSLTGFLVKNNEPQKICLQCKSKVEFAFDFNKLAVETQQILEKNLIKIEVTEVKAEIDLDVKSPEIEDFSDDDNKDEKAEKEAPIKKSYECEYCNKILQHYSGLVTHLKVLHPKMKKICEFCSKEYYLQVQLDKHLNACKKNPNRKKYDSQMNHAKYRQKIICPICGMLADKNHMKIHEKPTEQDATINQKPFICDLCGRTYRNRSVIENHMKYQHLGHKLKCKDCDIYLTQYELPKHQRRMHKYVQRTFRCRKCPFTTMKEQDLRNHRQTHKVPRIYKFTWKLKLISFGTYPIFFCQCFVQYRSSSRSCDGVFASRQTVTQ